MTIARQLDLPGAAHEKRCTRCARILPQTAFHARSKRRGDLRPVAACIDCERGRTARAQGYEPLQRREPLTEAEFLDAVRQRYDGQEVPQLRIVAGFPDYCVGSDDSLWGSRGRSGRRPGAIRKLKPGIDKVGYEKAILYARNKRRRYIHIHRLVLEVFVCPRPRGMVGAHNNGNPRDNRLLNLRWDTQRNNLLDKHKHGTLQVGDRSTNHKLTEAKVREIKRELRRHGVRVARKLAQENGVGPNAIYDIAKGKTWRSVS